MTTITDNGAYIEIGHKSLLKQSVMLIDRDSVHIHIVVGSRKPGTVSGQNVISISYLDTDYESASDLFNAILNMCNDGADFDAIVAIINTLTGANDTNYLSALNTLIVQLNGDAQDTLIGGLNELGRLLCPLWASETLTADTEGLTADDDETTADSEPI